MTQPSFDQLKTEIQSSRIIDGKRVATYIKEKAKADMALDGDARAPRLDVILVGDNPASATYVRNKQKCCDQNTDSTDNGIALLIFLHLQFPTQRE